jgi:hypothetical protein
MKANRLCELDQVLFGSKARGHPEMILSATVKILIFAALVATALIIATSPEPSSRGDQTDVPAFSSALPSRSQ